MQFSPFDLFWVLLLLVSFWPFWKQRSLQRQRYQALVTIEKARNSRVITLIHRQELLSLLGLPLTRFIDIEDSEQVLRAIRMTPDDMPIDLILHTPGGLVLAAEQIALAIQRHPAKVTVFVPHYAMSGGTLIALAADEIVMDANAVAGPVDPQIGNFPASSLIKVTEHKDINETDDRTLILADIARKATVQVREFVAELLADKMDEQRALEVAEQLTSGMWTHDYPITCRKLRELGLRVSCEFPTELHNLMELYPQTQQRRPSVQYVPVPYGNPRRRPIE